MGIEMKTKKSKGKKIIVIITLLAVIAGCGYAVSNSSLFASLTGSSSIGTDQSADQKTDSTDNSSEQSGKNNNDAQGTDSSSDTHDIDLAKIPEWDGKPSVEINGGEPAFTDSELNAIDDQKSEDLTSLDRLGRCGEAVACVSDDTMPEGERGSIGMIKPTGWHLVKYDFVDGKYLYNL